MIYNPDCGSHDCHVLLLEIEGVIETRARSVDVMKHNYYDLLYCFHTHRNNFRKGKCDYGMYFI